MESPLYESLKKAINEHFWLEERKMYASWEYPQYMGSPVADKVDVIANGYALLSDVASRIAETADHGEFIRWLFMEQIRYGRRKTEDRLLPFT